jgi:16S rRNA processing protein RimM
MTEARTSCSQSVPADRAPKMIVVGCIGSPHGIRGWMKLFSYTQPADNILHYKHWFIQAREDWQPVVMADLKIESATNGHIRIKFANCENPETARLYTNLLIAISREDLPALSLGDYYWSDLEGLTVVNIEGILLGQVSHLFSTGANDVLVVKGERERLLPYIKDIIVSVDLAKGEIKVDWDPDF